MKVQTTSLFICQIQSCICPQTDTKEADIAQMSKEEALETSDRCRQMFHLILERPISLITRLLSREKDWGRSLAWRRRIRTLFMEIIFNSSVLSDSTGTHVSQSSSRETRLQPITNMLVKIQWAWVHSSSRIWWTRMKEWPNPAPTLTWKPTLCLHKMTWVRCKWMLKNK